jgi:hypothetical protein
MSKREEGNRIWTKGEEVTGAVSGIDDAGFFKSKTTLCVHGLLQKYSFYEAYDFFR